MERYQELARQLHSQLCVIPAPSGQEDLRAAYCLEKLREFGLSEVFVDEYKNVICEMKGDTAETVIFAAHTDVVFPDEKALPYRDEGEKIYCPGCGDDTVCVAQLMSAIKKVKDAGMQPICNVVFALNACEEGLGNLKGTRGIMARYGSCVKAFITFDGQYNAVVDRSVGSHRYRVTVRTQGGHSYNDFGNENAARVLAVGIQMLYQIPMPKNGKTTCNVGVISGGTSVNTIIQEASMLCEYRSDCGENLAYMQKEFARVFDYMAQLAEINVELVGDRPGMGQVDFQAQAELSNFVATVQKKYIGVEPVRNSGSTDCNIPHSMGIPAVCAGTYAGGGQHTRQEWVEKKSIGLGVAIVSEIVEHYFR